MPQISMPKRIGVLVAAISAVLFISQSAMANDRATLVLNGQGVATAEPDMATIQIGTVTRNVDARAALKENNIRTEDFLDALASAGVAAEDIQTTDFSIQPDIVYPKSNSNRSDAMPRIVGYTVRNSVRIQLRNLNQIGSVLNEAVSLGANSVSGPQFTVSDPTELQRQARQNAMRDAIERATDYAEAGGLKLIRILSVQEGFASQPQPEAMMMMARDAGNSVPIASGQVNFTAQVTVSWEIDD